ncbi:hypothetical protein LSAT2_009046 [Lamellibrachia satsuma]|nr:hypothetical protein LSAT2_009046 [Lamellibrachia satsuma]
MLKHAPRLISKGSDRLIILPNKSVLLVCGYGCHKMPRSLLFWFKRGTQPQGKHPFMGLCLFRKTRAKWGERNCPSFETAEVESNHRPLDRQAAYQSVRRVGVRTDGDPIPAHVTWYNVRKKDACIFLTNLDAKGVQPSDRDEELLRPLYIVTDTIHQQDTGRCGNGRAQGEIEPQRHH